MSKLSTAERNRKNFEQARKVLFGTERIPGTDRERWTTAGEIPRGITGNFVLGPFEFEIQRNVVNVKGFGKIGVIRENFIRLVPIDHFALENFLKFKQNIPSSKEATKWDYKNGKFFVNYTEFADRLRPNPIPEIFDVDPNNKEAFDNAYARSKVSIPTKRIELRLYNTKMSGLYHQLLYEFSEPFPQGVIVYPNDTRILISSGFSDILIGLSKYFTTKQIFALLNNTEDTELCVFKLKRPAILFTENLLDWINNEVTSNGLAPLSVIETFTSAVDWLMHVLTGPDPRTFNSPSEMPHPDDLKESSEPMFKHFTFERDEWGVMHLIKAHIDIYFFAKQESTKSAELVRDETLAFLQHLPGAFADNFAKFMNRDEYAPAEPYPHTGHDFRLALQRLKQFTEHEFLGACSACGHPEPQFRCSETDALYCNQECQMIDARLTKQQKAKVSRVMREFAAGTLKSGSGERVTDRKQALAIAYSEARRL